MKLALLSPNAKLARVRIRKSVDLQEPTIQRMVFLKSDYGTKEDVEAAIAEHEFDIGTNKIVEKSDRFEVVDTPLTKFETVNEIAGPAEGFILYGGVLKADVDLTKGDVDANDPPEGEEETEETEETTEEETAETEEETTEETTEETASEETTSEETAAVDKNTPKGPKGGKVTPKPAVTHPNLPANPSAPDIDNIKKGAENDPVLARMVKFDGWSANKNAMTIQEVIKSSDDSTPLGVNELFQAARIALSGVFRKSADPIAGAQAVFNELASYGMSLVSIYDAAPESEKAALAKSILFTDSTLPEPTLESIAVTSKPVAKAENAPRKTESLDETIKKAVSTAVAAVTKDFDSKLMVLEKKAGQSPRPQDDEIELVKDEDEEQEVDPVDSLAQELRKRAYAPAR